MSTKTLSLSAAEILKELCLVIPTRAVGSDGNRRATQFFAEQLQAFGFQIELPVFDCMDWSEEAADLEVGGDRFEIQISPYSNGGKARARLEVVSTIDELEKTDLTGQIVLLRGEIAREPLMPKKFPFYNPEEHRRIYRLLEEKWPAIILTATARSPEMAGAVYPLPMFEDGDFDLPSAYLTEEEGARLARYAGQVAEIRMQAWRRPGKGSNVIGRKAAKADHRVVVCAHIDAKAGTPGAIDNAAGVTVLLLLAELLADWDHALGIEIAAINGEDYYSSPGEQDWLNRNKDQWEDILLGINLDGVGYVEGRTAYSLYGCQATLSETIRKSFAGRIGFVEGDPWYQGDHMIFLLSGVPALALTSERVMELMTRYVHTADDRPEIVDPEILAEIAIALQELIQESAKPRE